MIVAGYETKFTQLSRFAADLISTEESRAFRFKERLSQFLKDKLFLYKLETNSKVVESALVAKRSDEELQKNKEQQ